MEYQIIAPEADWPRIRDDPGFVELMRLGRVSNSLALAYKPFQVPLTDQSPSARRERFAGLMYSAALLKEGLITARSLGKWFRDLPQYKEGIQAILGDPAIQKFEGGVLATMRNELVFHFNRDAIAMGLARIPSHDMVVVSYPESGPAMGETYIDAADDAMQNYVFGGDDVTDAEYIERYSAFTAQLGGLFRALLFASQNLIAAGVIQLGCKRRKFQRPIPDDDD
jgi:hypothetical protein